jgi:hypothetical protein
MKIKEMTTQHIINRIKYLERFLAKRPPEETYMADSDYAEQAVESENRQNEDLADKVINQISYLKRELRMRRSI